ncbi:hypothetical protein T11_941 [Trichinella zimbabwensis]|uniref:Uncharacterized protein n=2 Tax=Trichinella TaxID=6333 RepID=A0A0V1MPT4_9BILA|nr:hypothetical protein T11_941 [Trichinella zimbabwensis]KRZ73816.1 hypothetical protein T10_7764 [Trichinella papuae]
MGNRLCINGKKPEKLKVTFGKPPIVKSVPMDQLPPHPVRPVVNAQSRQACLNHRAWVQSKIYKIGGYVYNASYTQKEYIEPYTEMPSWIDRELPSLKN